MSFNTIINTALSTLLKDGFLADFLVDKSGNKAISIFQQHFTFSVFEIAKSYQNNYIYALVAKLSSKTLFCRVGSVFLLPTVPAMRKQL